MASQLLLTKASIPSDWTTNTNFRNAGSNISAQFLAAGFVNVTDANGINWSTVQAPTLTNTSAGYEVWRFADALQSSFPIYFRVDYGDAGGVGRPRMWFNFGTSASGSGIIAGNGVANAIFDTNGSNATDAAGANQYSFFCGDTGSRFVMGLWAANNGSSAGTSLPTTGPFVHNLGPAMMMGFERTKNTSGVDTSEGLLVFGPTGASASWRQMMLANDSTVWTSAYETTLGCIPALSNTAGPGLGSQGGASIQSFGITVEQYPFYPIFLTKKGGVFTNPMLNAVVATEGMGVGQNPSPLGGTTTSPGGAQIGMAVTIPMFDGSNHTYICLGKGNYEAGASSGRTANTCVWMRWE